MRGNGWCRRASVMTGALMLLLLLLAPHTHAGPVAKRAIATTTLVPGTWTPLLRFVLHTTCLKRILNSGDLVPETTMDIDSILEGKEKRPFCNAFTGCGKKRSDPGLETVASGSELDALAKHVLAEAKLWEQLQNKMEMMRSLAARMESHPLYRRKRSPDHSSSFSPTRPVSALKHKSEEGKQQ